MSYYVICRGDTRPDGSKGKYVLATSRDFDSWSEADIYAGTVNSSREPKVLADQDELRKHIRNYLKDEE